MMAKLTMIVSIAFLLTGGAQLKPVPRAEDADDIKIHFHAFQYEPFESGTIENVVGGLCVFEFAQDSSKASRLRSFVYGAEYGNKDDFGYLSVRVKMENVTFGNLYLDKYGNILSAARWIIGRFGNKEFAELKAMLTQEARQHCEIYKELELE